ncbi:antitoxin Xre/MbcA/ParS toxin-binding domain-containing protein [Photobacterium satsumensis]|uniref:antitoxin Xre/MbcA/ParS toxin-binding domain-containing protein n=1 Tax=Photobacterium satsumensis TaxID=2910239 RepID=UPI003D0DC8F8
MDKQQIPEALYDDALAYFGDREKADDWLQTENIALGLVSPAYLCRTEEGLRQVADLLKHLKETGHV